MPLTSRAVDRAKVKHRSTGSSRSSLTSSSSTAENASLAAASVTPKENPQSHLAPQRRFLDIAVAASGLIAESPCEIFAAAEEREKLNFFLSDATQLGITETVKNDHNPNFVTSFPVQCESEADRAKCIRVVFYERRRPVVGPKPKPEVLCYADFVVSDLLATKEKCLDLPMSNKFGRSDQNVGTAFVSGEEFRSSPTCDMVTLGFGGDSSADLGGPDGKASSFFVVSRELAASPGRWKRVYRSPTFKSSKVQSNGSGSMGISGSLGISGGLGLTGTLQRASSKHPNRSTNKSANLSGVSLGSAGNSGGGSVGGSGGCGGDFRLESSKISSKNLYGNNCETTILIEYYQARIVSHRPVDPVLCAHVRTSMSALQKHMLSGSPLHMECEAGSWMYKAQLALGQGSLVTTAEGERKAILLTASKFSFYHSEVEFNKRINETSYVDKDRWARRETVLNGKSVSMTWRGSSFTTDVRS